MGGMSGVVYDIEQKRENFMNVFFLLLSFFAISSIPSHGGAIPKQQ